MFSDSTVPPLLKTISAIKTSPVDDVDLSRQSIPRIETYTLATSPLVVAGVGTSPTPSHAVVDNSLGQI
jgi:hypothetical protein